MSHLASISAPGLDYLSRQASATTHGTVDRSWTIRARRCPTAIEGWVADASVQIYINLGSWGRERWTPGTRPSHRAAWIIGPHAAPLRIAKETEDSDIVAARLMPGVARAILGMPATELSGRVVDLDEAWGSGAEALRERLDRATSLDQRLTLLEDSIAARWVSSHDDRDRVIRVMCRAIEERGRTRIGDLVDRIGLSHRTVIRLFEDVVGMKPKEYQRVRRFHRLLRTLDLERPRWSEHAYASGFADQSHMIREFRRLAGVSPRHYLQQKSPVGRECIRMAMAPWASPS